MHHLFNTFTIIVHAFTNFLYYVSSAAVSKECYLTCQKKKCHEQYQDVYYKKKVWYNKLFAYFQNIDSTTPKKEREDAIRNQKEQVTLRQKQLEERLVREQKEKLEYEVRKFRRRRYLQHHQLEQELLREVSNYCVDSTCLFLALRSTKSSR